MEIENCLPAHGPAYAEPRQRRGVAGKAGKLEII